MASVKYDGVEILNTTYIPRFVRHESAPERELTLLHLAREDGSILVADKYGTKRIPLRGIITGTSQIDLETKIDSFKELFSRPNKNLDLSWAGITRRYVANCISHDFDRDHFHLLFCPWTAEFVIIGGIGEDVSETLLVNAESFTVGRWTKALTFIGSSKPKPRFIINPSVNQAITQGLMLINDDNKQRIIIPDVGGITISDYEIDCRLKRCRKGTTEVKYYGQFPEFKIGLNNIRVEIGKVIDQEFHPASHDGHYLIHGTRRGAQSFTVSDKDITYMGLALSATKVGIPGGFVSIGIQTDLNGRPSGTAVTNAIFRLHAIDVPSSPSEAFVFMFTESGLKFTLDANTVYWIVASGATLSGSDVSNYIAWCCGLNVLATYRRGIGIEDTTGSWLVVDERDYLFKLYFMGNQYASSSTGTIRYHKRFL